MQYRVINKKTISGYASGVLMIMTTTVIADTGIYQQSPQYLPPLAINHYSPDHYDIRRAESGPLNPWQLPQKPENTPGFDHLPKYQSQPYQEQQQAGQYQNRRNQMGRFVTPEILESLKQQQMRTQAMPGSTQENQYLPRQPMSYQSAPGGYGYGAPSYGMNNPGSLYGSPSYGISNPNPLYNAPAVSPWGNGADILYRGESFPGSAPGVSPWVPAEAVGGLPPMHVPAFGESGNSDVQNPENVFNPFNFVPNRDVK